MKMNVYMSYLWFIADQQVVLHRLWHIVNAKPDGFTFRYICKPNACPGWGAIYGQRPWDHLHFLSHSMYAPD